jgi:hypothetical protein
MQSWSGNISKMRVSPQSMDTKATISNIDGSNDKAFKPIYHLPIGDHLVPMNDLIGQHIKVTFAGAIHCVNCHKKTKKSFNQGHCFPCMRSLARCDTCIIKPELCHYSAGTCREPEWGEANCLQDHFVYLANTGQVKVGITRFVGGDVSSRWFDQGATQAVAIFRVKERLLSGLVETEVAKHVADKTNWRTMLKGQAQPLDLLDLQSKVYDLVSDHVQSLQDKYGIQSIQPTTSQPIEIHYPVNQYPEKIKSINLDKEFHFEGQLLGIKGQYLLLDNDRVINVRKYTGYDLSIEA